MQTQEKLIKSPFYQSDLDSNLATEVRHAAVRCLSCETNFGSSSGDENFSSENFIVFSDNHCHALSLTFRLKDSEARGLKRTFGLVVLSTGVTTGQLL